MARVFTILILFALAEEHAPKNFSKETMSPNTIERLKQFVQDACGLKRPGPPPSRGPADPTPPVGERGPCDPIVPPGYGTYGGPGHINGYFYDKGIQQCEVTRDYGSATGYGPFKSLEECQKAVADGKCK